MYTHVVHRPRELRARHSVENQWDLLAAVDPAFAAPAGSGDAIASRCRSIRRRARRSIGGSPSCGVPADGA